MLEGTRRAPIALRRRADTRAAIRCGGDSPPNRATSSSCSRYGVVRRAAQHRASIMREVRGRFRGVGDAAVDDDLQLRPLALELVGPVVAQRRHFAVFLRRQALQPGIARAPRRSGKPASAIVSMKARKRDHSWSSSTPSRHFTVTGVSGMASIIAATLSATSAGCASGRHRSARPARGRTGQPQLRLISSKPCSAPIPRRLRQQCRLVATELPPPDARTDPAPAAARGRRGSPHWRAPFRVQARMRASTRWKARQCASVQSIIGATDRRSCSDGDGGGRTHGAGIVRMAIARPAPRGRWRDDGNAAGPVSGGPGSRGCTAVAAGLT